MKSGYEIRGLKELQKTLAMLPKGVATRAYRAALSAGARIIAKAAKSKVKKGKTGLLKKSIGMKYIRPRGNRAPVSIIGPRRGFKGEPKVVTDRKTGQQKTITPDPARYGHLVEKGTRHSAAQPFLRPALDQSESAVFAAMAEKVSKAIDTAASKKGGWK